MSKFSLLVLFENFTNSSTRGEPENQNIFIEEYLTK
jgi:hypothetical protein